MILVRFLLVSLAANSVAAAQPELEPFSLERRTQLVDNGPARAGLEAVGVVHEHNFGN